jgi:hypothetical protein
MGVQKSRGGGVKMGGLRGDYFLDGKSWEVLGNQLDGELRINRVFAR